MVLLKSPPGIIIPPLNIMLEIKKEKKEKREWGD